MSANTTFESRLIKQLSAAGFEVRTNADGQYHPVYHDGHRYGEVQFRRNGTEHLWLMEPNAASDGLFTVTRSKTWKGGKCMVTEETIETCVAALKLAAAMRRPGAT